MTTLHTIGHSNHSMERFLDLLRQHEIAAIADVRSQPYSKWVPHFRKESLAQALAAAKIEYSFLGQALGGRPEGRQFYGAAGQVDYESRARAPDFIAGIEQLIELASQRRTAILCAEEDPKQCHRQLLVAPALERRGVTVEHIRRDGGLESGPRDEAQLPLFG